MSGFPFAAITGGRFSRKEAALESRTAFEAFAA